MGVRRIFPLILMIAAGLAFWGLISIHHWLSYSAAGLLWSLSIVWGEVLMSAVQQIEYWNRSYPRWLTMIIGFPPSKEYIGVVSPIWWDKFIYTHPIRKAGPLIGGIIGTIVFTWLAIVDYKLYIGFAVMFTITWIPSIILVKRYFKHRYHRVTDWSNFPPL